MVESIKRGLQDAIDGNISNGTHDNIIIANALEVYKDYLETMIDEIPSEQGKNIERLTLAEVNRLLNKYKEF